MQKDKIIVCQKCGKQFKFTVEQQEFYKINHLSGVPSKCPDCRNAAKIQALQEAIQDPTKRTPYTCRQCGKLFVMTQGNLPEVACLCPQCAPALYKNMPIELELNKTLGYPKDQASQKDDSLKSKIKRLFGK